MEQGVVVWLTGLPSSGKTTLALALAASLRDRGLAVDILDGDELRRSLSADLGFSAKDRREQARRVTYVSKLLIRNGIITIVPLISPYRETRQAAREELGNFVEVYVKCDLKVCMERDVKGLYAKAIRGEVKEFTGISDPYEEPENAEVTVETHLSTVEDCCQQMLQAIENLGYVQSQAPYKAIVAD